MLSIAALNAPSPAAAAAPDGAVVGARGETLEAQVPKLLAAIEHLSRGVSGASMGIRPIALPWDALINAAVSAASAGSPSTPLGCQKYVVVELAMIASLRRFCRKLSLQTIAQLGCMRYSRGRL